MARKSRRKGAHAEREVRDIFRRFGFACERDGHGDFDGDLKHEIEGFHFEVKRHEKIGMGAWKAQAERDSAPGVVPVVIWRRSGEEWSANLPLAELLSLLQLRADA